MRNNFPFMQDIDNLQFWADVEDELPIMARITARVLPTAACSTDTERFFKVTKAVCSDHRSSLSPDTVNMCASMHEWLTEKYLFKDKKGARRDGVSSRFTTLSVDLELINPTELSDDDKEDDEEDDDEEDEG